MRKVIVLVIVLAALGLIVFALARSAKPVIDLPASVTAIGQATPITVSVRDPHGIRRLAVFVEQNGARYQVFETAQPSSLPDTTANFTAGVKTAPQLQAGKAKLIVEATSNDLLRKTASVEREVTVVTQPPSVSVDSEQHYLYLGMADLATFSVSGNWTEAGVRVGDQTLSRLADAGRQAGHVFALRFCLEHATRHRARGLCLQRSGQRCDQPAGRGVSQERAAEVHHA